MYLRNSLLWVMIFSVPHSALALSTDHNQPINIQSDTAMVDDNNGLAIYTGNVMVTQGSIRIDADKVTINYTKKQDLEKVVAEGKPAKFKQTPDGGKADLHAKSGRMEYFAEKDTLHLLQNAEVRQAQDSFTAQRIMYDTKSGVIQADKGESKDGRISVVIQPRSQKAAEESAPVEKTTPPKNIKQPK